MAQKNDPRRAGQVMGKVEYFGQFARFVVYPSPEGWTLADTETNDFGVVKIITTYPSRELAVSIAERLAAREQVAC